MVAKTFGGAVHGVDARTIMVEVSIGQGIRFYMSGLPDSAVKESQHRVESALRRGPAGARVENVHAESLAPTYRATGFVIR